MSTNTPTKDELREAALHTLLQVAKNSNAPPAARAAAARTLLESVGDIGRLQEIARRAEKPLTELTKTEIDAELERLRGDGDLESEMLRA
jgi:hypothetical protein